MSFITPAAKVFYNHQDHLGSTAVVTDKDSYLNQVLSYQPYGATRVSTQYGTLTQPNQFIGQDFDPESSLSYLNARYYNGSQGQFTSQDPVFWEVGESRDGLVALYNPQLQNSYSYAGGNPIVNKDPDGRFLDTIVDIGFIGYDLYNLGKAVYNGGDVKSELGYLALDVAGAFTPFATGFGAVARTAKVANKAEDTYSLYHGYNKSTNALEYVGTTKRDPNIRFTEHRNSGTARSNLNYEVAKGTGNLSKTSVRLLEQSTIENKGMVKNGGALLNKSNSQSAANKAKAYSSASNNVKKASDAIAKGDYKSASKYLSKASKNLKK